MPDYSELMRILSVPRPAGSRAEKVTVSALVSWLETANIPFRLGRFWLYPNFFIAIGIWLIITRSVLALAIYDRWGWWTLPIAMIGLLGGLLDVAWDIPLVGWVGAQIGKNILVEFGSETADQEIVVSAHYDSKTELFDHQQRRFFTRNLPTGIALTALLGLLGPVDRWLLDAGSSWVTFSYALGLFLSAALLILAWGLGLNMALGRLARSPSQGAVDNGAACAILLGLAEKISQGKLRLERTRLTLALFGGEEVNMQGSRAYAKEREWRLPAIAINLEVMAQNGDYVYWEQDGTALKLMPTSNRINHTLEQVIAEVTGKLPIPGGPVNSDGYSFLRVEIPATTLGTYDRVLKDRGFHQDSDNLERVVMARLPEAVEILERFIHINDRDGLVMNMENET